MPRRAPRRGGWSYADPFNHLRRRRASVGDAIRNADTPEAAAGNVEPGMTRQRGFDSTNAIDMPDFVLRVGAIPPVDAREHRHATKAKHRIERADGPLNELAIRLFECARV